MWNGSSKYIQVLHLECGIERIAMAKFGIDDMRLLYENNVRFLKQFGN